MKKTMIEGTDLDREKFSKELETIVKRLLDEDPDYEPTKETAGALVYLAIIGLIDRYKMSMEQMTAEIFEPLMKKAIMDLLLHDLFGTTEDAIEDEKIN